MIIPEKPKRTIRLKSRLLPVWVLTLIALQIFFPYKGWMILLIGFGGMWLLSYLWAKSLQRGLEIERELRFSWQQVGDRLRERILLRNQSWAPSLWVEIEDHSDMSGYDISSVSDVRGYRQLNWHTQGVCDTRGLYTLGPVTLRAQDPFGVYQVSVEYSDAANMIVVPPVIALPEIEIASGGRIDRGRSSSKGVEQTINAVGVREYVPGDSLRWVHWPTVARKGDFYVQLFENEPSSDWWVLLDLDPEVQVGEGSRSTEEYGVILAASLVNRGLQLGKHVGLIAYGDELAWHPPNLGNAHLWSVLRSLAGIRAGGPPLDQILTRLRTSLEPNTSLVIITANLTSDWVNALILLTRSGIVPTVLILDPTSFEGRGEVETLRKHLRKLGVAHYTISADLLDQPKRPTSLRDLIWQTRPGNLVDKWQARWQKLWQISRNWGLILLFFVFMSSMLGTSIRGLETELIWFFVGGATLTGWLLARSKLSGWWAAGISTIMAILLAGLRIGRLDQPFSETVVQGWEALKQYAAEVFRQADPADLSAFNTTLANLGDKISGLSLRCWQWLVAIFSRDPYYDPVAITILWAIIIWFLVVWAMWGIFRYRKPLTGLSPAIIFVVASLALSGQTNFDLIFVFGAASALMAFVNLDVHEQEWLRSKLNFRASIRPRFFVAASLITVSLMTLALLAPMISIESIREGVQRLLGKSTYEERLAGSVGFQGPQEDQAPRNILDVQRVGGMPNQHLIGSGPELSEDVVMLVYTENRPAQVTDPRAQADLPPLYLHSLSYDQYTGFGWNSRSTQDQYYAAGEALPYPETENPVFITHRIQLVTDLGGLVFSAGPLVSVDQDFEAAWRIYDERFNIYDLFGALVASDTYRVQSLAQTYSEEQLRAASRNYPAWMVNRYISLPVSVPENVITLARDLTATEISPYDRAVAIEAFLRKFPYNLNVAAVPAGKDVSEFFLFELQEGYCDYYATSMVVLARAAGIPARYVTGYIGENYDPGLGAYVITADQAHAWPEIYFPGYGWVPFEPTAGRPAIERAFEIPPEIPEDFNFDYNPFPSQERSFFDNWGWVAGIILWSVVVLILIGRLISDLWLARQPQARLLPNLFRRLYRYGGWMRLPSEPGETPYEFTRLLSHYIRQVAAGSFWANWLLQSPAQLQQLTEAYVWVTFNPPVGTAVTSAELMGVYKKLRRRLWLIWFLGRVHRYTLLQPFFWAEAPLIISIHIEDEL